MGIHQSGTLRRSGNSSLFARVTHFDAHHRLFWSCLAGVLVYLVSRDRLQTATRWIAAWDSSALAYLVLASAAIFHTNPRTSRRAARLQDTGRTLLFALVLLAAATSFVAVGFVLGPSRELERGERFFHIALSAVAVICSWLLTHTVFALRYAHMFYAQSREGTEAGRSGGLEFPGTTEPDYLDFVYFSYVIGMTSQVSDVQITSQRMRRHALFHGMLAFAFNTIILALSINVVAGLI